MIILLKLQNILFLYISVHNRSILLARLLLFKGSKRHILESYWFQDPSPGFLLTLFPLLLLLLQGLLFLILLPFLLPLLLPVLLVFLSSPASPSPLPPSPPLKRPLCTEISRPRHTRSDQTGCGFRCDVL